ncbi:MAG: type II toxin-antitoxin system RelE/ParE family toxin [Bacteroidales bacterium]|nr:type II toxin-antitoxin system RelE/ParE family toxin [Bacteroidales bacterium]MCF8345357.1 type II toxin-antitoxin system RelE/ParE family toxin [Bacteroidales bacterium]MCF8352031.1 type II toxin-antitoxin system RelE/ParE family toxin [Bacteroidales bacterium]MCF8375504.1 type II toxin-antitoxin system RelE/ParE family toxin [Bacteroidales bacterium]MCF8399903.1 type II toxin-antitoxin system RelE/ParE family toxin [Bacteroidales bacterium]
MKVEFDKSFLKNLSKINNPTVLQKVESIIIKLEDAKNLNQVDNLRKLTGYKNYYRIRIGNYRLGFEKINQKTIRLIVIADRKDIYKNFP